MRITNVLLGIFIFICLFFSNEERRFVWFINSAIKSNKLFNGVVLIAKDNRVLYEASSSGIDISKQKFSVASISKQFTSVLVFKEVEKGNIVLSETANTYLNDAQRIDDRITVYQLLTHTSGIRNDLSSAFVPGSEYEYSNYGYKILGFILENVTKRHFYELGNEMLQQVGMKGSFFLKDNSIYDIRKGDAHVMPSFIFNNQTLIAQEQFSRSSANNCVGGLVSTAYDLTTWNFLLHNNKILSLDNYNIMISPAARKDSLEMSGCGIFVSDIGELTHHGYLYGYKATLSYFPRQKISLVILENISTDNFSQDFKMHREIRKTCSLFLERL